MRPSGALSDAPIGQQLTHGGPQQLHFVANEESLAGGFVDEQAIPVHAGKSNIAPAGKGNDYFRLSLTRFGPLAGNLLTPALAEIAGTIRVKLCGSCPLSRDRLAFPLSPDVPGSLCGNVTPVIRARRDKTGKQYGGESGNEPLHHFRLPALY